MSSIPSPLVAWRDARTGLGELIAGGVLLLVVAAGTISGSLPLGVAVVVGLAGVVAALVEPRLFLFAYVALIPFDGATALGGVATLSRIGGIGFAAGYLVRRRGSLRLDTMGVAGWAFIGFAAASVLWSIDPSASEPEVLTVIQLFLITVLAADIIAVDPRIARWLGLVYAASALVMGTIGLWIWLTDRASLPAGRAAAFAGQDTAQFTSILIPALLVLVWEALRRPRAIVLAAGLLATVAILASGTRSAEVAVALAVVAGIVPRISMRQRVGLAGIGVFVLVLALVVPPLNDLTFGRVTNAITSGGTGRTDIWTIGLGVWTNNPIFGVGYGAFPSALTLELVRATSIPTPDTGFLRPPIGSHSLIVGTLVELGVIGLGCLLAFLWSVVRPRQAGGALAEMARLAVLAMLVQALFLDILGRKQLWLFIAIAVGLTAAARLPGLGSRGLVPEPAAGPSPVPTADPEPEPTAAAEATATPFAARKPKHGVHEWPTTTPA